MLIYKLINKVLRILNAIFVYVTTKIHNMSHRIEAHAKVDTADPLLII